MLKSHSCNVCMYTKIATARVQGKLDCQRQITFQERIQEYSEICLFESSLLFLSTGKAAM